MSNQNTSPPTLTFFRLDNFTNELRRRKMLDVRCEAITLDIPSSNAGAWRKYIVVLTAFAPNVPEVLVCAILTGEGWAVFSKDSPHYDNLEAAEGLVRMHLSGNGFEVLDGMYHHEKDGQASANGLWRYDENQRLIPAWEQAGEAA